MKPKSICYLPCVPYVPNDTASFMSRAVSAPIPTFRPGSTKKPNPLIPNFVTISSPSSHGTSDSDLDEESLPGEIFPMEPETYHVSRSTSAGRLPNPAPINGNPIPGLPRPPQVNSIQGSQVAYVPGKSAPRSKSLPLPSREGHQEGRAVNFDARSQESSHTSSRSRRPLPPGGLKLAFQQHEHALHGMPQPDA